MFQIWNSISETCLLRDNAQRGPENGEVWIRKNERKGEEEEEKDRQCEGEWREKKEKKYTKKNKHFQF